MAADAALTGAWIAGPAPSLDGGGGGRFETTAFADVGSVKRPLILLAGPPVADPSRRTMSLGLRIPSAASFRNCTSSNGPCSLPSRTRNHWAMLVLLGMEAAARRIKKERRTTAAPTTSTKRCKRTAHGRRSLAGAPPVLLLLLQEPCGSGWSFRGKQNRRLLVVRIVCWPGQPKCCPRFTLQKFVSQPPIVSRAKGGLQLATWFCTLPGEIAPKKGRR